MTTGKRKILLGGVAGLIALGVLGQCAGDPTLTDTTSASAQTRASSSASPSTSPSAAATTGRLASGHPSAATRPARSAATGSAAAALAQLRVKGRAPMTGYSRDQFGPAWADVDGNGCDTRNDILARDLTGEDTGNDACTVLTGTLVDPYSGRVIHFHRGMGTSSRVQIDHVVALGDAWQTGAQQWTATRRAQFANDPLNLLAVDGPLNESKGDADAASWLPPNKSYRCHYVARQVAVKARYGLWVTSAEHDAIARILATCPAERLPASGPPPRVTPKPTPRPTPKPSPKAAPAPAPQPKPAPYYANCSAVRAAGAAPIHFGDPGYSRKLDRDGDGIACE